jgi:hypothetical protein
MDFEVFTTGDHISMETHDRICNELRAQIKALIIENETLRHRVNTVDRKTHALKIIRHWASQPGQLDLQHVKELIDGLQD